MALEVATAGLTTQQAAFVAAYLGGNDASKSAILAGYEHPQSGYACLKSEKVQRAIRDGQVRMIETELGTLSVRTVMDLMKPGNPPNIRLGAAGLAGKWAGFADRAEAGQQKALTDMSADELSAFISKLDGVIAGKADAAAPVKDMVITGVASPVEGS